MDVTFVTNTNSDADALAVLKALGLPFQQNDSAEKAIKAQLEKVKAEKTREAEEQEKIEVSEENNEDVSEESDNIES